MNLTTETQYAPAWRDEVGTDDVNDVAFDWYRRPGSARALAIAEAALADVDALMARRERARRHQGRHRRAFEASIHTIIANASLQALRGDQKAIYVPRSKAELGNKSRYRPNSMTESFPQRLDALAQTVWITQTVAPAGRSGGRRSTIAAGPRLLSALYDARVGFQDFTQGEAREVIMLKGPKPGNKPWDTKRPLMEYQETPRSLQLRAEVRRINKALSEADITVTDPDIDVGNRHLVRAFHDAGFKTVGRYAGGFWTPMKKDDRFEHIHIDGERVVELDFVSLHPRIAYALAGAAAPSGDLYAIPGLEAVKRGAVKLLLNTLFWDERVRTSVPKGSAKDFNGLTGSEAVEFIKQAHPALVEHFGVGIGGALMGIESEIMTGVLVRAIDQGLTVLPIHDAVLVPVSREAEAREVMETAYRAVLGCDPAISRNADPGMH